MTPLAGRTLGPIRFKVSINGNTSRILRCTETPDTTGFRQPVNLADTGQGHKPYASGVRTVPHRW